MKKQITVGIIGAGRIGRVHAQSIAHHIPGARIKTIADVFMNEETKKWAENLGVENTTRDYMDILNDPEIEAVLICSSTNTHAQFTIASARAGKHIFCEKPLDPSVVIPGRRVSNLQTSVVWGTAESLGTGYTVNSAYLYITPSQIVLEEGESEADVWPEVGPDGLPTGRSALLVPRVENSSQSLTTANSSLSLSHDVPVNMVLHRTLITVLDSNGDRTDTPVTEIGVKFPPQTLQLLKMFLMPLATKFLKVQ